MRTAVGRRWGVLLGAVVATPMVSGISNSASVGSCTVVPVFQADGRTAGGWSAVRAQGFVTVTGPRGAAGTMVRAHLMDSRGESLRGETAVCSPGIPVCVLLEDSPHCERILLDRFGWDGRPQ